MANGLSKFDPNGQGLPNHGDLSQAKFGRILADSHDFGANFAGGNVPGHAVSNASMTFGKLSHPCHIAGICNATKSLRHGVPSHRSGRKSVDSAWRGETKLGMAHPGASSTAISCFLGVQCFAGALEVHES